ncbi:MAG: sensor histidine kinase [Eubacteriales bacterium]|nr:sensor histidine kinase [Eubacteriales bacterium]
MHRFMQVLESRMNNYNLKKKLHILYIFCMLIPLIITDSVIIYIVVHSEQVKQQHVMENAASAVQYSLSENVETAASKAKNIYMNEFIDDFLNRQYERPLDYVEGYQTFLKDSLFETSMGVDNTLVTIYADNETIINGGYFCRISEIRETEWYRYLQESGKDAVLYFYYDDWKSPAVQPRRKAAFIRKMNFFGRKGSEKVVKVEMDYSSLVRDLDNLNYESFICICRDEKVLISNNGLNYVGQPFQELGEKRRPGYQKEINAYGENLQILVYPADTGAWPQIREHMPLILLLVLVNAVMPWILMRQINCSFTARVEELSRAFDNVDEERLQEIDCVRGRDEIGRLMQNYNRMAVRLNELIQTVYKDRLREQEMDIARQNAELLALQSQVNPHFLFNALESIRMHSILKQEYETADMVGRLAVMERQNVDWSTDLVEVSREMEFVEAYLGLQKYRFGDRLSYELDIEPDCSGLKIPRLTMVTFVENACVHGIEKKAVPCWIFVRVYRENSHICIEVEDTGCGMAAEKIAELKEKMENASIEKLRRKGRVGIVNACLRLKMVTDGRVRFFIESEEGVGTTIQILIPTDALSGKRELELQEK